MTVNGVLKRGIYVLQKEGARTFLSQVFSFLVGFFYSRGSYYIYEKTLTKNEKYQFNTKLQNTTIKIISAPEEFEQLVSDDYDFKMILFKDKLKKGTLAFCIFLNKELIQVTWVALNERAKKELNQLPYKVEFNKKEVYSGTTYTKPCYKGKNLLVYTYSHILPYLAQRGMVKDKFTIEVNNISSQKAHAKFNPIIIGKGHYLKILWWEFWKEEPIKGAKI
jgi:hypothetical protein